MNFSNALQFLKAGALMTNKGWNGKDMFLTVQFPDGGSLMTEPYIFLTKNDMRLPWIASQYDLFSDEWEIVKE